MALSAWLILLAAPAVASADVFNVNTTIDANDNVCEGIAPGDCPLRAAVNDAANGDTINVPAGNHVLTVPGGVLLIDVSVTIIGAGARQTVISGNNASRVIHLFPPSPSTPISVGVSGVTLTNGNGVGGNNPNGGAVHVAAGATLALTDSAVTNSDSQNGNGGGIYTDGTLTLNRVTVSGNQATGAAVPDNGGGIYHNSNSVTITNSTISGNTTNGSGGGIYSAAGLLNLQSTTIADNTAAPSGSGLYTAGLRNRHPGLDHRGDQRRRVRRNDRRQQQPRHRRDLWRHCRRGEPAPRRAREQRRPDGHARPRAHEPRDRSRQPGSGPLHRHRSARGRSSAGRCLRHRVVRVRRDCAAGRRRSASACGGQEREPAAQAGNGQGQAPGPPAVPGAVRGRAAAGRDGGRHAEGAGDAGGRRRTRRPTSTAASSRSPKARAAKPRTTLTLVEKLSCPKAGSAIAAAKKKKRRLWGDGSGKFRTKGKHSAATVVGTKWLVEDRCRSTLTRVVRGRVSVRDFAKKKTVIVRRGKRYIARAG